MSILHIPLHPDLRAAALARKGPRSWETYINGLIRRDVAEESPAVIQPSPGRPSQPSVPVPVADDGADPRGYIAPKAGQKSADEIRDEHFGRTRAEVGGNE